uniref:Uncharacterized protein n=1 Tax=Siphoviridae sp. ctqrl18 TaxID=2825681 RepID=A0A8S5NSY0_9CAUD|nr:MAG TPA: hypothetical protein [Siphoviridae sp. ctqrl18]
MAEKNLYEENMCAANNNKKEKDIKKNIDKVQNSIVQEEAETIIDTTMLFGKCRIIAKNIKIYKGKILTKDNLYAILGENETFYFDRLHNTNKGNVYVSWGDFDNERIYAPYRIVTDNNSPVIRISE